MTIRPLWTHPDAGQLAPTMHDWLMVRKYLDERERRPAVLRRAENACLSARLTVSQSLTILERIGADRRRRQCDRDTAAALSGASAVG